MKITKRWLEKHDACKEGIDWFLDQKETDSDKLIKLSIRTKDHLDWANWLIVRTMNPKQNVMYSFFAAEQVIDVFEERYPNDNRPRKAINAAKAYIKNPCKKTEAAVDSAYAAAYTAFGVDSAYAAVDSAYAAAYTADIADIAYAAYEAAAYAASYAGIKLLTKTLKYGLKITKRRGDNGKVS